MNGSKINSSAELRALLLCSIEGVLEGRVSVPQANSVTGLSGEVHKSIRSDWDMAVYAAENISYSQAKIINSCITDGDVVSGYLGSNKDGMG